MKTYGIIVALVAAVWIGLVAHAEALPAKCTAPGVTQAVLDAPVCNPGGVKNDGGSAPVTADYDGPIVGATIELRDDDKDGKTEIHYDPDHRYVDAKRAQADAERADDHKGPRG